MSERPPAGRLLAELGRELRGLGRRRRRQVLDELHDHLCSAIEDEVAEGAAWAEAERRAVARFGDAGVVSARLLDARPRRGRRAVHVLVSAAAITASLALAGSIGRELAPRIASAASVPGPSATGCAQAFTKARGAMARTRVGRAHARAILIIPTSLPSCVIKVQLSKATVLTAVSPWASGTAASWTYSTRPGRVPFSDARWTGGRVVPTIDVAAPRSGPAPTVTACAAFWNARPPVSAGSLAAGPVLVRTLAPGSGIISWNHYSSSTVNGPGCTVSVIGHGQHTTRFWAPWSNGRAVGWIQPRGTSGVRGTPSPNADLTAKGRLAVR